MNPQTFRASAARTSNGQDGPYAVPARGRGADYLVLTVDKTAVSGTTPTLDLELQWGMSTSGPWATVDPTADSFSQLTDSPATETLVRRFEIKGSHFRLDAVIAGAAASFTYEVEGGVT